MARQKKLTPPEQMQKAFETVMAFPEGERVLRHILYLSGYNEALMMLDPVSFEVNQLGTVVNVAKRDMWLEIRKYLKPEHLLRLEQPQLETVPETPIEEDNKDE